MVSSSPKSRAGRTRRALAITGTTVLVAALLTAVPATARPSRPTPSRAAATSGCATTTDTEYATGSSAAAIGWPANEQAVVACLSGSFVVKNTGTTYGFGIYDGSRTTWTNAQGHLPALVTAFHRDGAAVRITDFADRIVVGGHAFVAVYSRVAVSNPTGNAITLAPQASAGLTALGSGPDRVAPGRRVVHDYVVASDRFGASYAYPSATELRSAGGYGEHFAHMRQYWNQQLSELTQLRRLPDPRLIDAYDTGFEYTQISRSGAMLKTGVNGYDKEYSHDVIGILATMLTQGFRSDGHTTALDLLLRLREVVGTQAQYDDGIWKYSWPWAIYLQKTGDVATVRKNFRRPGPKGDALQPSIRDSAHAIAAARTGPGGIIEATNDIDANGYWTIDDYSALMGLASYRWLARRIGEQSEFRWATREYDSLLAAVNRTLTHTISTLHLHYLPCSMVESNADNRCSEPKDANWAAPFLFGRWAWDGYLFDANIKGPGSSLIDATYRYGFDRLKGVLPPNTYGGYGTTEYSTGYNAGYGEWGLAGSDYRSQGIKGYEFMINRTQSGPYSWWESVAAPDPTSPWVGSHPSAGGGASPHAWGAADANLTLLASLVAERGPGQLIIGRGVPTSWLRSPTPIQLANVAIAGGRHLGFTVATEGKRVSLHLTGQQPEGQILFQLPAFVNGIAASSAGRIDERTGTVTLPPTTGSVVVTLRERP